MARFYIDATEDDVNTLRRLDTPWSDMCGTYLGHGILRLTRSDIDLLKDVTAHDAATSVSYRKTDDPSDCAEYLTINGRDYPVKPDRLLFNQDVADRLNIKINTWTSLTSTGAAPDPEDREIDKGHARPRWFETSILVWHRSRPGSGARTDLTIADLVEQLLPLPARKGFCTECAVEGIEVKAVAHDRCMKHYQRLRRKWLRGDFPS